MKMQAEHYQYLKSAIDNLDKQRVADHKALELGKDKDKRFLLDISHMLGEYNFICNTLYPYLNDDHIHTALKQIAKELKL